VEAQFVRIQIDKLPAWEQGLTWGALDCLCHFTP